MNTVNGTDVTLFTLATGDLTAATSQLLAHAYTAGAILAVVGILLVIAYHKYGSA